MLPAEKSAIAGKLASVRSTRGIRDTSRTSVDDLIQEGDLTIRLMRDDVRDYKLIATWLTNPAVLEFYEGRDNPLPLDRIKQK